MPSFDTDKLFFFERSAANRAGKGTKDIVADPSAYEHLDVHDTHWRRILSPADTSCGPFMHDGMSFDSIEHGVLYAKAQMFFPKALPDYQNDKAKFITQMKTKKIPEAKAHEWDSNNAHYALASSKFMECKKARDVLVATLNAQLWLIRTGASPDIRLTWLEEVRDTCSQSHHHVGSSHHNRHQVEQKTNNKKNAVNVNLLVNAFAKQANIRNTKINVAVPHQNLKDGKDPWVSKQERLQERLRVMEEVKKENKILKDKLRSKTKPESKLTKMIGRAKGKATDKTQQGNGAAAVKENKSGKDDMYDKSRQVISKALMEYGASADAADAVAGSIVNELRNTYTGDARQKVFSIIRNLKQPTGKETEPDLAQRLLNGTMSARELLSLDTRNYYPSRDRNLMIKKDRKQTGEPSINNSVLMSNITFTEAETNEITTWKYGHAYNMLSSVLSGEPLEIKDAFFNSVIRFVVQTVRRSPAREGKANALSKALEMKTLRVMDRLQSTHAGVNGLSRMKVQLTKEGTSVVAKFVKDA